MTDAPIVTQKLVMAVAVRGTPRHETAQIALVGEQGWKIVGPFWSESGKHEFYPLPQLDCPVVDLRQADADRVGELIRKAITIAGCPDVPALLAGLERVGGRIL